MIQNGLSYPRPVGGRKQRRRLEAIRLVGAVRGEEVEVVPFRRRAQTAEHDAARVVAALNVRAARIDVREVAADLELVADELRRLQADRAALVAVVRPEHEALVVVDAARQEERAAIITAGDRNVVVGDVAGLEHLVEVIVRLRSGGERLSPAVAGGERIGVGNDAVVGEEAVVALAVRRLQRIARGDLVERIRRVQRVLRLAGLAALRRDQNDALCRACAVDRGRRGAFQNRDRLDVVRIQIGNAVRVDRALLARCSRTGPAC